jgi:hypothetical protein
LVSSFGGRFWTPAQKRERPVAVPFAPPDPDGSPWTTSATIASARTVRAPTPGGQQEVEEFARSHKELRQAMEKFAA